MSLLQHHSFGDDPKRKVIPPVTSTTTTVVPTTSTTTTVPVGPTTTSTTTTVNPSLPTTTTTTSTTTTLPSTPGDVTPTNPVDGQSMKSGLWSQPSTWKNNVVPDANTTFTISTTHTVTYDLADTRIRGGNVQQGGTLQFKVDGNVSMRSDANIVVNGTLKLRPTNANFTHTITFINIDESKVVGGGMNPLATDVGMWVMGNGKLDILGAAKKPWTRTTSGVSAGATSFTVQDASGWRVGDVICIVPMDQPSTNTADWDDATSSFTDSYRPKFERRTIQTINGNTISFSGGLVYEHPQVVSNVTSSALGITSNRTWNPEVMNLSRNVKIQGTKDAGDDNWRKFHRTHIYVRSSVPQSVYYLEIRYTGPRKIQGHPSRPELISGRYGFHLHHCMDGSRGSMIYGCAIYDSGNRCYVPHMSHGVTMNNNVAFNTMQEAFWWDWQEITHDCTWEDNIFACCTQTGNGSNSRGMLIQIGDGNVARRNVGVYAHSGDPNGGGAYAWDADSEGVWIFEDNMSHSCVTGLFVWQNTVFNHTIIRYDSFNCYQAIFHGAYINSYTYRGGHHYRSLHDVKATSGNDSGALFLRVVFDAGGQQFCTRIHESPIPGGQDVLENKWIECVFRNYTVAALRMYSTTEDSNVEKQYKYVAIIKSDYGGGSPYILTNGENYDVPGYNLKNNNQVRVQPISGQSFKTQRINQQNVYSTIPNFATTVYGTGMGLMGYYYYGSNFNELRFTRLDSMLVFGQWTVDKRMSPYGVHYKLQGDLYSMRWIGKIEPQFSEPYVFIMEGAGGHRVYINNVMILDSWFEKSSNDGFYQSSPVNMVVGQRYDIKIEHFNSTGARSCLAYWKCPSMPNKGNLPQAQLYVS